MQGRNTFSDYNDPDSPLRKAAQSRASLCGASATPKPQDGSRYARFGNAGGTGATDNPHFSVVRAETSI